MTLILTSSHVVQNETLARCLVICFRLHFTRDSTVNTIAGATIRQLVPVVLERVSLVSNPQDTKSKSLINKKHLISRYFNQHILMNYTCLLNITLKPFEMIR